MVDIKNSQLRIALPKGRMAVAVQSLLEDAGIRITPTARGYRPRLSLPCTEAKVLKPQNIVEMLDLGTRDVGFAGADWVAEMDADLIELLDTGLDPVRIVVAAPSTNPDPDGPGLVIASEYERLARNWISSRGLDAQLLKTWGATEVFPPDDADLIMDNTATGATLEANGLVVIDEVMQSSTRLYASRRAMADPPRRDRIVELTMLLTSVLEARKRAILEVNVSGESLAGLVAVLPCMKKPTVAELFNGEGYAVKAAVPRADLASIIPAVRAAGATDVIVSDLSQIIP